MNKENNIKRIVVPSMTLDDVGDYLMETVFSNENLQPALNILNKNFKRYKKTYRDWLFTRDKDDLYKIFNPLPYNGKYPQKLTAIPYWSKDGKDVRWITFTRINHNGFKGIALGNDTTIDFYSEHCIERYAERCLGEKLKFGEIDDIFIGDMLIYNEMSYQKEYEYQGVVSIYEIVRDGVFLSYPGSKYKMIRTFITSAEFFEQQKAFVNKGINILNPHLLSEGISPISLVA